MAGILGDLASSLTGNIEKAIIEIVDARDSDDISVDDTVASTVAPKFTGVVNTKNASELQNILGSTLGTTTGGLNSLRSKQFTVQFNPSELRISGTGGGMIQKANYSAGSPQELSFAPMKTRIMLTVPLIFDKVNPKDAFMFDKFTLSETSVATGLVQAGMKAFGAIDDYSVKKEVEGFIAAIRNERTRQIFFYWGHMCYTGILNRVTTSYTMFSVSGQPIRAKVDLTLVCADQNEGANNRLGFWKKAYETAFKDGEADGLISYAKASQAVGNLLNFNL